MDELLERLRAVQMSSLCDADKALPVVASEIRAMLTTNLDEHLAALAERRDTALRFTF